MLVFMTKISLLLCTIFSTTLVFSQMNSYAFKRKISGVSMGWNSIQIPNSVYGKINTSYSDIRIFGITQELDTFELPYLLRAKKNFSKTVEIQYELINRSKDEKGFYYTFKVQSDQLVNEINLSFGRVNFDWKIRLEGSHDQKGWKTILSNYRILSLENDQLNYSYTDLHLPQSDYTYFRLFIPDSIDPELALPVLKYKVDEIGEERNYSVISRSENRDTKNKITELKFELENAVPISEIKLTSDSDFDFYRRIEVYYWTDSLTTSKGTFPNYRKALESVFSSLDTSSFFISEVVAKHYKLVIHNEDNLPLDIGDVQFKGVAHELVAHFQQAADYFLVYGNKAASKGNYDIAYFQEKIPDHLKKLQLGSEMEVAKKISKEEKDSPLFTNMLWLWILLGVIITVLGFFTYRMMRSENSNSE
jgi:hypothetical protein